jgi:hypothetical protein
MATSVTKWPADGGIGKSAWVETKAFIQTMIDLGMITTSSTIAELNTALTGEIDWDDPRS